MRVSENKEQLWRSGVESQRSSGLSVKLWCEKEKISQSKFYEWRKRLLSEGEKVPNLIKVSMAGQENDGGLEILTPLGLWFVSVA